MPETRRRIVHSFGVAALVLAIIWINTAVRQARHFHRAESYARANRVLDAIAEYESTIRMYTPGSGKVKAAIDYLWRQGNDFEVNGQIDEALIAFRSLKASLYSIRSFYSPYLDVRSIAEIKVDSLLELTRQRHQTGESPGDQRPPTPPAATEQSESTVSQLQGTKGLDTSR